MKGSHTKNTALQPGRKYNQESLYFTENGIIHVDKNGNIKSQIIHEPYSYDIFDGCDVFG